MCPPSPLDPMTVDKLRPGPALGRAQYQHRPELALRWLILRMLARNALNLGNLERDRVQCPGQRLMHRHGVIAFDKIGIVAIAIHQRRQLVLADSGEHRGVGDFVAVQMQDWQHRAVTRGVEELVGVPTGRQRPRFGLAITDHASDDQVGVIERRTVGMGQAISQFAALMNRPWYLRRYMAGNAIRPGKLPKQTDQAITVALYRGIALGKSAFQISLRHHRRPAMAGTGDEQDVQVVLVDQPVEVRVDQVQSRRRAPMAQ
ncbi:hypothetical protein D3C76_906880 [compost metagenome]